MREPPPHDDLFDDDPERLLRDAEAALDAEEARGLAEATGDRAHRIEALERSRRNLLLVLEITRRMIAKDRTAEVLDLILDAALRISGGDRAYLLSLDEKGRLRTEASRRADGKPAEPAEDLELSRSILDEVLRGGRTLSISDASQNPDFMSRRSVRDLSLRTIVCVPLRTDERVAGALYVDSRRVSELLTQEGVELLETFAAQAAIALERVAKHERLEQTAESLVEQNRDYRRALERVTRFERILGESPAMKKVFVVLDRVIENPVTVHIQGETGTGKELVAQAVHFNGPRRNRDFVAVNCGAFSPTLLESELFGAARGAYTGADRDRTGVIERANGGTLFLDEIGEIPHPVQVSLLRVLQEGAIRRLGENSDRKVDVRLITATHRNLERELAEGRIREDFFFRINVVTITLPPLREREDDVLLLAEHFLERERRKLSRPGLRLSRETRRVLLAYPWPGNVRELEHALIRAAALSESDEIRPDDLTLRQAGTPTPGPAEGGKLRDLLRRVEIEAIGEALQTTGGNVSQAAKRLGMSRQNLHARIRQLEIQPRPDRS